MLPPRSRALSKVKPGQNPHPNGLTRTEGTLRPPRARLKRTELNLVTSMDTLSPLILGLFRVLPSQDTGFKRGTPLWVSRGFQLLGERSGSPSPGAIRHWGATEPRSGGTLAPAATRWLRAWARGLPRGPRRPSRDRAATPLSPHLRRWHATVGGVQPPRGPWPFTESTGFGSVSKGISGGGCFCQTPTCMRGVSLLTGGNYHCVNCVKLLIFDPFWTYKIPCYKVKPNSYN